MKQIKNYIPATAVTLLIPLLSLINPNKLPDVSALQFAGMDKVIHMFMYAVLTAAWCLALPAKARINMRWMLTLALLSALYGLILEICQFVFTTTRSMDMLDAVANLAGALVAALMICWLSRLRSPRVATEKSIQLAEGIENRDPTPE